MSIIVEIAVDPIGTGSPSVGDYIKRVVEAIEKMGLKHQVGPMGTSIELESMGQLCEVLKRAHDELYMMGIKRIVTTVRIDDRRDKDETMEYKVRRATGKG